MAHLHEILAGRVSQWRAAGYACPDYPAIGEIFDWAVEEDGDLRFLRRPQLRALETYWYLRLVERTPHVFDLYRRVFTEPPDLLGALGLNTPEITKQVTGRPLDSLWERIRGDDAFVKRNHLEALRETITLAYPSYILALAMGAGKTVLIGAIVATEFAMALEYPQGPFVHNALVFAPGKTIVESLKELAIVPYARILPPRHYKAFAASVKLTFTRDGERDIPVTPGSLYNVVVTNTEKIRIQKESIRRSDLGSLFPGGRREDEARAEIANARLQAIASLPRLAVFSDEAHHTYGQSLESELKKVRRTVDYLARNTEVACVVNTTGTPYFRRQPLRDVVIWYGLSQGIRENILKDVSEIQAFDFGDDARAYVQHVVTDFFGAYGDVRLPDGAPAKLAVYFPQNDDLDALRPAVDAALAAIGQSPTLCLRNTSQSTSEEEAAFNRLNDPAAPHRVLLLVNKGTEGWNCPSLFACALARRLRSSNNFVLQAATRCLRQVPGNRVEARIYLSRDNRAILDRQLQETYGETIADLQQATRERAAERLVLRKRALPPLTLTRTVRTVTPTPGRDMALALVRPAGQPEPAPLEKVVLEIAAREGSRSLLQAIGGTIRVDAPPATIGAYEAATDLAGTLRLDLWSVHDELRRLYPEGEVPVADLADLARQLAEATRRYEVHEEQVEWALALVRPEGFAPEVDAEGRRVYTTEITYPKEKEQLLLHASRVAASNPKGLGFHYDPYNFDSGAERDYYQDLLRQLNVDPGEVEDVLFTGGLTDPAKTDFRVEYQGEDGRPHFYTPDFVIRKRPPRGGRRGTGRVLIVEVKDARFRASVSDDEARWRRGESPITVEGRKAIALRGLEALDPARLRYELVFSRGGVTQDQVVPALRFVREPDPPDETDRTVAERLKDLVVAALGRGVRRVILFGSRARGDARPDSDYDLLVVLSELPPADRNPILLRLYRLFRDVDVVVEPHVMGEEEFEETRGVVGSLAHPAAKEGVVLYESA